MRAFSADRRNALLLSGVAHFASHFFELMYPTLAVVMALDLRLPLPQVLGWSFAGYLLFGLAALPGDRLAGRLGARSLLLVGLGGMGVSALAAAEAAPGHSLAMCLACLGLFAGLSHSAGRSLIAHAAPERGPHASLYAVCGNLGIALTPLITALLAQHLGVQHTFHLAGLALCTVLAALTFLPADEADRQPPDLPPPSPSPPAPGAVLPFLFVCVAAVLGGILYRGSSLVLPAYLAERVSLTGFGAITTGVYLVGLAGRYGGGRLAKRYDVRWPYLAFHAVSLPLLLLMSWLFGAALAGTTALFLFFSLGMQPLENDLFARFSPPRWRAAGYGIQPALGLGCGALAVPLIAQVRSGPGLSVVFLYLAAVVALLVVTSALVAFASAAGLPGNDAPLTRDKPGVTIGEPAV